MHNTNIPDYTELPSNKRLLKSTIIAIVSAVILLFTIVLPAEYGIDPTGIGSITGLKRMGEIKTALAEELEAQQSSPTTNAATNTEPQEIIPQTNDEGTRSETMSVTLEPNQSTEIKLTMKAAESVEFTWSSDSFQAFYDLHGDSKDINYHVYEKGTEQSQEGTLTAAFDGNHGWYWKNRSDKPIAITLTVNGNFQAINEMN